MNEVSLRREDMSQETKEILSRIENWKNVKLEGEDIRWVLYMKTLLKHNPKALGSRERQHFKRIRDKINIAFEYLTLTAELLPTEGQLKQTFREENLKPFIEAVLKNFEEDKVNIVKNERVFRIAFMLAQKGVSHGRDLVKSPLAAEFLAGLEFLSPENSRLLNFVIGLLRHQHKA